MVKRTLFFGNPAYIHKKQQQLKIKSPETDTEIGSVPIEDIGVVILDHPQITFTNALLQELLQNNVAFITTDQKHHPAGMLLNLNGHSVQAERFRTQLEASEPLKKNLWQQTVYCKVMNQAKVLELAGKESKQLLVLLPQIKSGDSSNVEARAASVYWKLLFNDFPFVRERYGEVPNVHLNYAYAILRAMTARALVGSGMLPTFGIFHRNKYNAYALADDIMEPYRPFCDLLVYTMIEEGLICPSGTDDFLSDAFAEEEVLTKEHKARFLSIATVDVLIDKKRSPLMVALSRTTSSLYECFEGKRRKIVYPELDA